MAVTITVVVAAGVVTIGDEDALASIVSPTVCCRAVAVDNGDSHKSQFQL